uniref:Leucine-rich repeat-containing N-terminal plant-type domain-containing protein n=1 Tax=Lactuca sativa TaxID=4236 RepID=A0A9R1X0W5_LACSA|nr:hypothetical protein LSAT_V11C800442610 [Lactuca sativa]
MGNPWGLGLHLISISIFLLGTTYTCLGVGNISAVCTEEERLALLKFKQSVQDDSKMLSSWVGNDCCMWERVHCDDDSGNVKSLDLRGEKYDGEDRYYLVGAEVNSYLAQLKHLTYLDLSGNDFGGSRIPKFIGSLKQLSYLNLSHAGFQGIIPHQIGNLSNLKVLDLGYRDLMIDEPLVADDVAWTFGLSSLEHLDLSSVNLGEAQNRDMLLYMIPSLKELSLFRCRLSSSVLGPFVNSSRILPNIKHLDLGSNSFEGPLPGFFQNLTSLAFLDLSDYEPGSAWNFAKLLKMIPSLSELHLSNCWLDNTFLSSSHFNFSTLSNIQHLNLRWNSIGGIFPSVLTNMSSLRVLDLTENILNSWVPVMPNLVELHLSYNMFNRFEQLGIWRHCHLIHLDVAGNVNGMEMIDSSHNVSECSQYALESLDLVESFQNGTIPEALGRMVNLRFLYLSRNNRLTGPIPKSLGRLRHLDVLDLSTNDLTGPIPTFLGKLSVIDLSWNQLMGSIPKSFGNIATLRVIKLSNNQLNGSIPESFRNLAALRELDLANNQLTGPIPASLGRLVSLRAMMVWRNLLNGNIPVSIGQLAKLQSLDISYNFLEGVVYEAHFANLSMLNNFDASFNMKLTFNVSREWTPPFQLQSLQLGSCNIINGFPQWLQNQRKIESLVLSNATISGPLPMWLQKTPIIAFLDLSNNKLIGPLTYLPNRGVNHLWHATGGGLLLQNNLFNGSIPRSLCTTNLQYLDLSKNRLTGKIPDCFKNLKNLVTMRFSSNRLRGVIPSSIALNSLIRLRLNSNNFIGELPQELGNLRDLEVLDVGDNKLSGDIPIWIGENLTSLMVLRLHKNNFRGRIPRSLCNTSKLQILDVAYNNLTGTIPHCLGELNAMVKSDPDFLSHPDHDENLIQGIKGVELEFTKNLGILFNMDLSSNKLVGEIPVELTALCMLVGLNLSNNHLSGVIPGSIGNLTALNSLDLSRNELTGMIPRSMAALTFLSYLNLSRNNLWGRIPTGNQLQTLDDPSIYVGNKDLCGPPLPKICSNQVDPTTITEKEYEETDHEPMKIWFYVGIMCGFATGFWGVIGVLLFKKQWRLKLFESVEETIEKIYVAVVVLS